MIVLGLSVLFILGFINVLPVFLMVLQASELIALLEEGVRTHYVPPRLTVVSEDF